MTLSKTLTPYSLIPELIAYFTSYLTFLPSLVKYVKQSPSGCKIKPVLSLKVKWHLPSSYITVYSIDILPSLFS